MRNRSISWAECAVLLLVVTLLASVYALIDQENQAKNQALERTLASARVLASFARESHVQYSTSISSAFNAGKLSFSVDPSNDVGSIHYPASFSRNLTERFSAKYPNANFAIYSNDPFGTSKDRTLDDFAIEALAALQAESAPAEYWQHQKAPDGSSQFRLAIPIIMQKNCTSCHNAPKWNLDKRNWQAGDLRGVREVSLRLSDTALQTRFQSYTLWGLVTVSCSLGLFFVYPAVRREVAQRSHVERLNEMLNERARQLQKQSITDSQTGLCNRRRFDDLLSAYVTEFGQNGITVGLAIFDLDHFKRINDTHGHYVGDQVIAEFGKVLRNHVREHDFAARIGGEEFAMVIPNIVDGNLRERAEQVRQAVTRMNMRNQPQPILMSP